MYRIIISWRIQLVLSCHPPVKRVENKRHSLIDHNNNCVLQPRDTTADDGCYCHSSSSTYENTLLFIPIIVEKKNDLMITINFARNNHHVNNIILYGAYQLFANVQQKNNLTVKHE